MSKKCEANPRVTGLATGTVVFISGVSVRAAVQRTVPSSSQSLGEDGGAYRDRTDDLMLAKQPLSQLS